jgi:hypothetical protein
VTFAAFASVCLGLAMIPVTLLVSIVTYFAPSGWERAGFNALLVACALAGALSMIASLAMFRGRAWGRRLALVLMPPWCVGFVAYGAWFVFAKVGHALSRAHQEPALAVAGLAFIASWLLAIGLNALVPAIVFVKLRHDGAADWFRQASRPPGL